MKEFNEREFTRLAYPEAHRPLLMVDVDKFEIVDVSEYGMKVKTDNDPAFMINDQVSAVIEFTDGKEFDLSGQVVRLGHNYAGLHLQTPLPQGVISSESLYLINTSSDKS